jgi:hypothetical protein
VTKSDGILSGDPPPKFGGSSMFRRPSLPPSSGMMTETEVSKTLDVCSKLTRLTVQENFYKNLRFYFTERKILNNQCGLSPKFRVNVTLQPRKHDNAETQIHTTAGLHPRHLISSELFGIFAHKQCERT